MSPFESFFSLLFGLAIAALLGFTYLIMTTSPHGGETSVRLGALVVASLVVWSGWALRRRQRTGLACLVILLGMPATLVGFILMLFVTVSGSHH